MRVREILYPKFKVWVVNINPYELKFALRQVCRENCPQYFMSVDLPLQDLEIPVNNLGRWLFGVKGFKGHYKQLIQDDSIEIWLPNVDKAVDLVKCGLEILKAQGIIEKITEVK